MWIQAGALAPIPCYAVVGEDVIAAVLRRLTADAALQQRLDAAFRLVEAEQPALAGFLATELSSLGAQPAQALCYFLSLCTFLAFREAFGARLGSLVQDDLDSALEQLVADGEVRSASCKHGSYSEDVIAIGQPALMRLVHTEIDLAPEGADDLDPVLQALLVQLVALTHAVAPLA
jgi:hypothetical protein